MRAYCLTCELTPQACELAQAVWYGLGMLGCEEEPAGEKIRLKCYFKDSASLHSAEFSLMDIHPSGPLVISVVQDEDWNARWKQSMKPVLVAQDIWVSPAWLKPDLSPGQRWIKIEPKMAFGTGHHETTRLACQALLGLINRLQHAPAVLDFGTGSGILCFVADCMDISRAVGVDSDPVCATNLSENLKKNKPRHKVSFVIGTVDVFKKNGIFDIIVMNMISSEGLPLLGRVAGLLKPDGYFIWSGLLLEDKKQILPHSLKHFEAMHESIENEWCCETFRRRG